MSFVQYEEDVLTQHLQEIVANDVEYDYQEARDNLRFMWDAVSRLISIMKRMDPLFRAVYNRIVHAGSFYEGLRITSADEFDLQIVLDFPFPPELFKIRMPRADSPFVTYQLQEPPKQILYSNYHWVHPYKRLAKFFDNNGFLSSEAVLWWVHGLMEQAFESEELTLPRTVARLERKAQLSSCPAFTLEITGARSGNTIDVDLVAVLNVSSSIIPKKMLCTRRFRQLLREEGSTEWFLVPKPAKNHENDDPMTQILWRNTFPEAEKLLLSDTGCQKTMIKIFKRLRDINTNWRKPIFSYVVKSLFMREFDKNPDLYYWSEDNLGQVFMESLEKFQEAMSNCYIPDYYNPKSNMIASINPGTAENIAGRAKNIIKLLLEDPNNILDVFA